MKILTIAATPFFADRGCHIRVYNEAKYLQKLGHEVVVTTYHNGQDVAGIETKRIKNVGWYKKTSPGFAWGKIWLDFKLFFLVRKEIQKFQPDVIHAHLYEGLEIGFKAQWFHFKKIPMIVDLQGSLEKEFESYNQEKQKVKKFFNWLSKFAINRADHAVVSSENALEDVRGKYKNREKISVVKDGIDLESFQNLENPSEKVKKELEKIKKWQGESKLLIYTGGLSKGKGLEELINEFRKISDDWKLLIFGSGELFDDYKNNLPKDKFFLAENHGYFDLPHYLDLADVAIDPKNDSTESSGKLMNYMAASLPIICFENEFNKARLGEQGSYMREVGDLNDILRDINLEKKTYNLSEFSEEGEVKKLDRIIKELVK
jgi:glycosyltransferase involved in cell wall biosynthesis